MGNNIDKIRILGEVFDYGPQITGVKIEFSKPVDKISIESFEILNNSKKREITGMEFYNERTVILSLEHGQKIGDAAIFTWDEPGFKYIKNPLNYSLKYSGEIIDIPRENLVIKGYEKFGAGENCNLKYRDFKPVKDGKKHPLVVWIHGAGEGGMDNSMQILGNRGGVAFVEEESQKIFDNPYVLAPQCPTFWMQSFFLGKRELNGEKDYTPDLMKLIKDYIEEHSDIDRDRIYLGGCSMGGYESFKLLNYAPEIFAAAFITCPAYEPSKEELERVKEIPIWLVHASKDRAVPVTNSQNSYKYLKGLGSDVVYTEYVDVIYDGNRYDPHGSYFYTLHNDPVNSDGTHIFQWVASKVKK